MATIKWDIPIRTVSEANKKEHWSDARKRHKAQQMIIRCFFKTLKKPINLPCTVEFLRFGTKLLDEHDNLPMAFKWIKDEVAACLIPESRKYFTDKRGIKHEIKGRADDDPRIKWVYKQEKTSKLGIRITFEFDELQDVS